MSTGYTKELRKGNHYKINSTNVIYLGKLYKKYIIHRVHNKNKSIYIDNIIKLNKPYKVNAMLNLDKLNQFMGSGVILLSDISCGLLDKIDEDFKKLVNQTKCKSYSIENIGSDVARFLNNYMIIIEANEVTSETIEIVKYDISIDEFMQYIINDMCIKINQLYDKFGDLVISTSIEYLNNILLIIDENTILHNKNIRLLYERIDKYIDKLSRQLKNLNCNWVIDKNTIIKTIEQYSEDNSIKYDLSLLY